MSEVPSVMVQSPETQIPILLRRFGEESSRMAASFGERHALNPRDVAALAAIAEAEERDRPIGPARLAAQLTISTSGTTALIDRLEAAGHVMRRPDADDRRRTVLVMQPEAYALAAAFFAPLSTALDDVIARLTDEQRELITTFLRAAVDAVRDSQPPVEPAADQPRATEGPAA